MPTYSFTHEPFQFLRERTIDRLLCRLKELKTFRIHLDTEIDMTIGMLFTKFREQQPIAQE